MRKSVPQTPSRPALNPKSLNIFFSSQVFFSLAVALPFSPLSTLTIYNQQEQDYNSRHCLAVSPLSTLYL
uniref:Uncharacterized protein n=1 Tax=Nelumbo nucifera TaxID=4432 RepID=A0A822Z7U2_NELNU|nr:TPA_asm: hypothetical protein HUJ06_008199 [Nelumbo nucifera]